MGGREVKAGASVRMPMEKLIVCAIERCVLPESLAQRPDRPALGPAALAPWSLVLRAGSTRRPEARGPRPGHMWTFISFRIAWPGARGTQPLDSGGLPSTVESKSLPLSPQPQCGDRFIEIVLEMY